MVCELLDRCKLRARSIACQLAGRFLSNDWLPGFAPPCQSTTGYCNIPGRFSTSFPSTSGAGDDDALLVEDMPVTLLSVVSSTPSPSDSPTPQSIQEFSNRPLIGRIYRPPAVQLEHLRCFGNVCWRTYRPVMVWSVRLARHSQDRCFGHCSRERI